jgi:hypothetical protein
MLYDPKDHYEPAETISAFKKKEKLYERLLRSKQFRFLKNLKRHVVLGLTGFISSIFFHN